MMIVVMMRLTSVVDAVIAAVDNRFVAVTVVGLSLENATKERMGVRELTIASVS